MAPRLRRRFPLLALLGIMVAGAILACFAISVMPIREEVCLDLNSAVVEDRVYVCGWLWKTERCEAANRLSSRYREIAMVDPNDERWVTISGCNRRLLQRAEYLDVGECWHYRCSTSRMNGILELAETDIPEDSLNCSPPALDELVRTFVELLGSCSEPKCLCDYAFATHMMLFEFEREVTAADIISAETWLADPVPEHYYGPPH